MPGRGSATTPGRAISTPARKSSSPRHGGVFPADEAALRRLPGVGDYTAAAIAAIAFDLPATRGRRQRAAGDGAAACGGGGAAAGRPRLVALARALTPAERPGDFAQAMMDLGATVCTPRRPRCPACPWQGRLRRSSVGPAGRLSAPCGQGGKAGAPRSGLLAGAGGRRGAGAPPAQPRPARRHDGVPVDALAGSAVEHRRGGCRRSRNRRTRRTRLGAAAGRLAPHLHPLPPRPGRAGRPRRGAVRRRSCRTEPVVRAGRLRPAGAADLDEEGGAAGGRGAASGRRCRWIAEPG